MVGLGRQGASDPQGEQIRPHEHPEHRRPWQRGRNEALDGALAATGSRPAGTPQHREPSRHREHGQHHPA